MHDTLAVEITDGFCDGADQVRGIASVVRLPGTETGRDLPLVVTASSTDTVKQLAAGAKVKDQLDMNHISLGRTACARLT